MEAAAAADEQPAGVPQCKEATSATIDPGAGEAVMQRKQDVIGAVSRRAVPQSDSDGEEDAGADGQPPGETRRHMFRLVDFEPAVGGSQGGATASGQKKRQGSRGAKRRWCAKEFDTEAGRYTCSTDGMCKQDSHSTLYSTGMFGVKFSAHTLRVGSGNQSSAELLMNSACLRFDSADVVKLKVFDLGNRPPFVALVHRHSLGGTTYDQVDSETGTAGGLLHMRRGDVLSVRLTAVPDATSTDLRAIERIGGTLSIELCMRKRKRVDDFAEEGDPSAASAAIGAAVAPQGKTSKASRRRERKRRAAGPPAPAVPTADSSRATSTIPSALEPDRDEISACSESDHTGSDTEWSEGFSSDDEDRRKTRPSKRMRRLAREIRDVQVTTSDDDNGTTISQMQALDAGDIGGAALGATPTREDIVSKSGSALITKE